MRPIEKWAYEYAQKLLDDMNWSDRPTSKEQINRVAKEILVANPFQPKWFRLGDCNSCELRVVRDAVLAWADDRSYCVPAIDDDYVDADSIENAKQSAEEALMQTTEDQHT